MELALLLTRIGCVLVVVGIAVATLLYCSCVGYHHEDATENLLTCINRTLTQEQFTFWLDEGSLLGAARLKKFVVWDPNIDIAILADSRKSIAEAVDKIAAVCRVYTEVATSAVEGAPLSWQLFGSRTAARILEWVEAGTQLQSASGFSIPFNHVFPLQPCTVGSNSMLCPSNLHTVLASVYGSNWGNASLFGLF